MQCKDGVGVADIDGKQHLRTPRGKTRRPPRCGAGLGLFSGQEGSFVFGPWQTLDLKLIGVIAALAAVILVGSVGAALAYQNGPPATVAAFDYSYLVFSLCWGFFFFDEMPALLSFAGVLIILAAGFLSLPRSEKSAS